MSEQRASAGSSVVTRRRLLRAGVLGGLGAIAAPMINLGRCRLLAAESGEISTRAVDLVLGATVIDMLGLLTLDWDELRRWQVEPGRFEESDYRRLERSGVSIFHPAVEPHARDPHLAALLWTRGWSRLLQGGGCFLARVASIEDLARVPRLGKIGVVVGFQNSDHFRTRADVEAFHRLGQRVSQLTYNERNRIGSGCHVRKDRGLTRFGAEVVIEMNRVGMAIDLSHCGDRTSLEAIALSHPPVLVTHSNCRALVPAQPRCKSDAVIRALAAKGGVMGITLVRAFVGAGTPTLDDLLDHFDHVARVAGIEHVGLGSDVDVAPSGELSGPARSFYDIRGLDPKTRVFQIADGLLRRGHRRRDVELVLGGNFLRALAAIWPDEPAVLAPAAPARRDPFCPAPHPLPRGGDLARG
jgi:membrane dipeptidase